MRGSVAIIIALMLTTSVSAQLYSPGEVLNYKVSYRAKMFPNTEVGTVSITTTEEEIDGKPTYKVVGHGRTLPVYRWFFNVDDKYTLHIDRQTLRTLRFESDLHEGSSYTFTSTYIYDWTNYTVATTWQSRQREVQHKTQRLTNETMDAISLFFNMRSVNEKDYKVGERYTLKMVLQDTIRQLRFRYIGREEKKIRQAGRFRTLKLACELGTSEGFSVIDGTEFYIWLSDDENKIPLWLESPIKIGSVCAYISDYKGLKYPLSSRIK